MLLARLTIWLLIGAVLGGLVSVSVSSVYFPLSDEKINVRLGERYFEKKCSGCHSVSGKSRAMMGPNLKNVALESKLRKKELSPEAYILESILEPDAYVPDGAGEHMPADTVKGMNESSIRNLVAYITSLSAPVRPRELINLNITESVSPTNNYVSINPRAIEKGRVLFDDKYNCDACHSVSHEPGSDFIAPSLNRSGQLETKYILESISEPSKFITPGYQNVNVVTKSGKRIFGRLLNQDDLTITLLYRDKNGNYTQDSIELINTSSVEVSSSSLMPKYEMNYTEMQEILAFLKFNRGQI